MRLIDADAIRIPDDAPYKASVRRVIAMQPTVEAEPVVHGKWETVHGVLTPGGDPLLRCPFCKSRESEHMGGIEFPIHWNFCPICGAKMDGGVKNE